MATQRTGQMDPPAVAGLPGEGLDAVAMLDRQVRTLVGLGYPDLAGMTDRAFIELVAPLRALAADHQGRMAPPTPQHLPMVLVISRRLVAAERAMPLTSLGGRPGFIAQDIADIGRFDPIEQIRLPATEAYLLLDVQRGDEYLNWSPDEALVALDGRGRTPLTYDEGIAMLTLAPATLERNRCFMLAGSRCGDRRVPALWISGGTGKDGRERRGAPKLGWCWAGNRHTWLGHASACARVSAEPSAV